MKVTAEHISIEPQPPRKCLRDAEFVVFGVVTEYCVRLAAKGLLERGRRVSIVQDAIETLKPEDGERTVAELDALGAKFISTDQALALAQHKKQS